MAFKILNRFLNSCRLAIKIIYPSKCVLCEKIIEDDDVLCCECWRKIRFIRKPHCDKCSNPFQFKISDDDICSACSKNYPLYLKARSAVLYGPEVGKIMFKFKFYDKIHLKRFIAKCMIDAAEDIIDDIDIFIPIPIHRKRLLFRKYNQSLLLANEIARKTNKKCLYNFLVKTKHTTPQVELSQEERRTNLKNKFSINPNFLKDLDSYRNMKFAIVDDVITTGSTINECVKTMNDIGIESVYVISFAKTLSR